MILKGLSPLKDHHHNVGMMKSVPLLLCVRCACGASDLWDAIKEHRRSRCYTKYFCRSFQRLHDDIKMPLTCRFYEHKFPEVEDVVMVNVRSIAEMGAYVHLLEYNNIEGMILLSELSRRRIRSINKLIRVGRSECVVVIRVDKDKGEVEQRNAHQFSFKAERRCKPGRPYGVMCVSSWVTPCPWLPLTPDLPLLTWLDQVMGR